MAFLTLGGNIPSSSGSRSSTPQSTEGTIKVSQNKVLFNSRFRDFLQTRVWSINLIGSTASYTTAVNNLSLISGTASGSIEVFNRRAFGIGNCQSFILKASVKFGDLGETNNIRCFGFGDTANGFLFRLNGTSLEFVIKSGGSTILTSAATSWSIPFTLDTNEHIYWIQFNSTGLKECYIYVDNVLRKTIQIPVQGMFDSIQDVRLFLKNENTTTVTSSHTMSSSGVSLDYEFDTDKQEGFIDFSVTNSSIVSATNGADKPILAIKSLDVRNSIQNKRRIVVKRIHTGCANRGWLYIYKNATLTGGTKILPETISNPSFTPTLTLDTNNAAGSGYADGNTVEYKVGVIGSQGKSLPSATSASLGVGTPKKRVKVSWTKHSFGLGYEIFRRINGAGNYERISVLPMNITEFYDDAYISNAAIVPAVANDAVNESFVEAFEGMTISGGQKIYTFRIEGDSSEMDADIFILPLDTLTIVMNPDVNDTVAASILWEEEVL